MAIRLLSIYLKGRSLSQYPRILELCQGSLWRFTLSVSVAISVQLKDGEGVVSLMCGFTHPFISQTNHPSIHPSTHSCIQLTNHPSTYPFIHPSIQPSTVYPPIHHLSVHQPSTYYPLTHSAGPPSSNLVIPTPIQ